MSKFKLNYRYRCAESELYSVCRTGWQIHESQQAVFTSRKAFYTSANTTSALAEIDAAQNLPDSHSRGDNTGTLRLQMVSAADESCMFWQLLKSHIETAYSAEFHKIKIEAAGGSYYTAASRKDWEKQVSLMSAGNTFINENTAKLLENDNMPATFAADFADSMNTFNALYDEYKKGVSSAADRTKTKVEANNAIYQKLMSMFKDARIYFRNNPTIKEQFVFENLLKIVSSNAGSGLTGTILDAKTGGGLGDVILSMFEGTNTNVPAKYTTHSEGNGAYNFGTMANGSYTLRMEHAGFVTRNESIELTLGVSSTKTFMMHE